MIAISPPIHIPSLDRRTVSVGRLLTEGSSLPGRTVALVVTGDYPRKGRVVRGASLVCAYSAVATPISAVVSSGLCVPRLDLHLLFHRVATGVIVTMQNATSAFLPTMALRVMRM